MLNELTNKRNWISAALAIAVAVLLAAWPEQKTVTKTHIVEKQSDSLAKVVSGLRDSLATMQASKRGTSREIVYVQTEQGRIEYREREVDTVSEIKTVTVTHTDTLRLVDSVRVATSEKERVVSVVERRDWLVQGLAGVSSKDGSLSFGGGVSRRVVGPFFGGWTLANRDGEWTVAVVATVQF